MRGLAWVAFGLALLVVGLAGCGGAGGGGVGETGGAAFTIEWPQRSRWMPKAAESVKIEVSLLGVPVTSALRARPPQGGTSQVVFPVLPVGEYTYTAYAYPEADGTGVALGYAAETLAIQSNGTTPVTLTMASTITSLVVAPATLSLRPDETAQLIATPRNAQGQTVLAPAGNITWVPQHSAIASVNADGLVTGRALGETTITATELDSGRSAQVAVTVEEAAPEERIAFASDRDGDFDIYLLDPATGALTQLTNHTADDTDPAMTPDGSRVAFVSNRDGNTEIYAVNADGTGLARLTNHSAADRAPSFGQMGAQLAFVSNRDGHQEIYRMNADGSAVTRLTDTFSYVANTTPHCTRTGVSITFSSTRAGNARLFTMYNDGGNVTQLTNYVTPGADTEPAYSPDQSRIVFVSTRDGNRDIYVMNAGGGNVQRLTTHGAADYAPAFSPDGQRIIFVSERDDNPELYIINLDGTGLTRLTNNPADDLSPAWAVEE